MEMTAEELFSYLCHSTLPTLLVEGKGDKAILRRFGEALVVRNIDILPVGGKGVLGSVYERRQELTGSRVVFMRDRDEFCVISPPEDFADYVLTSGYSIENDVLDREVINRLAADGAGQLAHLISVFSSWFQVRFQNYILVDQGLSLAVDVTQVVRDGGLIGDSLDEVAATQLVEPFSTLDCDVDSWRWLRGKSLLRVIHHHFQASSPSYSMEQLSDLCIKMGPSTAFSELTQRVLTRFA